MRRLRYIAVLILLSASLSAWSQQRVVDVGKEETSPLSGLFLVLGGEPISFAKYVKVVEGTAFFSDNWMKGSLIMEGGKKYDGLYMKLDLMEDEVHYKDPSGNEFIADNRIREIWLTDSITTKKYHFVHSSFIGSGTAAATGWHQLIADGSAMLFKKFRKQIDETKPYGSATTEQRISTESRYFILSANVLSPVKSFSTIPDLLSEKKTELQQYISTNKLKGKSDGDYISLVSYYNSLPK